MRAQLPKREPDLLARWQAMDLYQRLREQSRGREPFILHDGPPYANGHLHIGHALNKILKDIVNRCQQMLGKDANYVPGWDCHGLPIEWKIEEKYRAAGRDKDQVPAIEFRRECREFADHWVDIQRGEFKRLGIIGDWDAPYSTMTFAAEAQIVRELGKFLMNGALYRGAKPVMWSVVERTALAEAEVEYYDHTSSTIFVRFPVSGTSTSAIEGASVIIWTTTPWTMPGNRAIAYGRAIEYGVFQINNVAENSLARSGESIVVALDLAEDVRERARIADWQQLAMVKGKELAGTICHHPLHGQGYDFNVPLLPGDFVDIETGTGFVHIAPGHGVDDWELGVRHNVAIPDTVGADGVFLDQVPLFAGRRVLKHDGKEGDANSAVIGALTDAGGLMARGKLVHSYPHSWRSKAPLIFRNTPQWFISMEKTGLRDKALAAIDATRFVPQSGRNRLRGMIETRPDWCVSRQRAWGVPITVFIDKRTGEPLRDQRVLDRIADAIEAEGADTWFASPPERFLAPEYDAAQFDQVMDILDVWFDSGATHSYVLEAREDLSSPASLYLEGSDQHRGWFHSSLLESCGTRGRAPYDAVLTHGFVLDEEGKKMSKALGNVTSPQDVVNQHGADVLRLWVAGSDYADDLRIGPEIVKQHADAYRRFRNTFRFILGNLHGFVPEQRLEVDQMPELERWVLHRLTELDRQLRETCGSYEFLRLFNELHSFCTVDLSAFYFDIRKDSLYCDAENSMVRRATLTVLDTLFECLTAWLAPFMCFTTEEAWLARYPDSDGSVHMRLFPDLPAAWNDEAIGEKWATVRKLRRVVTSAIEIERAAKRIGSSLEAAPTVYITPQFADAINGLDLSELFITSDAIIDSGAPPDAAFALPEIDGVFVTVALAKGNKCARCWKVLPEVGQLLAHPDLCLRCADAVGQHSAAAE